MATENNKKAAWAYTPKLPIQSSPMFDLPQSIFTVLKYFLGTGFLFSQRTLYALVAVFAWWYAMPEMSMAQTWSWAWMLQVLVVIFSLNLLFGWGYHWLFYTSGLNAKQCKFDQRPLATNSSRFWFGDQLWDNVFFSLTSGVFFASLYMAIYMWGYANGDIVLHTWQDGWVWYVAVFPITVWWTSLHFYLVHRMMHEWQWLYDKVHALHHKNINIGPWSGMAMHPVEHAIYLSSVLVHLVLPSDPIHVLFHLIYLFAGAYLGHIGHDGFYIGKRKVFAGGNFYHQLHHRYFDCNYGTNEVPWDKWFGSFHSGTEEDTQRVRALKASR